MEAPDANKPASSMQITIIKMKKDETASVNLLHELMSCKGNYTTTRNFLARQIRGKNDAAQETVFLNLLQLCEENPDAFFDASKVTEKNSFMDNLVKYRKQRNLKARAEKLHDLLCNVLGLAPFRQQQANSVVDQYFLPFSSNLHEFLLTTNLKPGTVHTEYHHEYVNMMQELGKEVETILSTIGGTSTRAKEKVDFLYPILKETGQSFWAGGTKGKKAELEGFLKTVLQVIDTRIAEEGAEVPQKSLEVLHKADALAKINEFDSRLAVRMQGDNSNEEVIPFEMADQLLEHTVGQFDDNALTEGDAKALDRNREQNTTHQALVGFVNSLSSPHGVQECMEATGLHKGVRKLWFCLNPDERDKNDEIKYEVAREDILCFMLVFNAKFADYVFAKHFQDGNKPAPKMHQNFVWYTELKKFLQDCFCEEESKLFGYFKSLGWVNSEMDEPQRLQRAFMLADVLFQLLKTKNPLNIIQQMTEDHDDVAEDRVLDENGKVDDTPWLKKFENATLEWLEVSQKGKFDSVSEFPTGKLAQYSPEEKAEISGLCKTKTRLAAELVDSPKKEFLTTTNDMLLAEYLSEQEGTNLLPEIVMAATCLFVMVGPDNLDSETGQIKPECSLDLERLELLLEFIGGCFARDMSSIVWHKDDAEHVPTEQTEKEELDCDPEDETEANSADNKKQPMHMLGPALDAENEILNECLDDLRPQLLSHIEKRLGMLKKHEDTDNTDEKAMLTNALDFGLMTIESLRALASNLENKKPKSKDESDKEAYKQAYKELGFWCEALRFIYGGHLHRSFNVTGEPQTGSLKITAFSKTYDGTPVFEWINKNYKAARENPKEALQLLDRFLLTLKLAYGCKPPVCFMTEYDCFGQIEEKKFKTQTLQNEYLEFIDNLWVLCNECDCMFDTTRSDMKMYEHLDGNCCKDTHRLVPRSKDEDPVVLLCEKCHYARLEASNEAKPCGTTNRTRRMRDKKGMRHQIEDDDQSTKGQTLFSEAVDLTDEQQEAFEHLAISLFAPQIELDSLFPYLHRKDDEIIPVINQAGGEARDNTASKALETRIKEEMAKTSAAIEGMDPIKLIRAVLRALCQEDNHNAYFRHGKVCPCCYNSKFPVWYRKKANSQYEPTALRIVTVNEECEVEILTNPEFENVEKYRSSMNRIITPSGKKACTITPKKVRDLLQVIAHNVDDIPTNLSDRLRIVKSKEGNAAEISFGVCSNPECWRWMCLAIYDHYLTTPIGKKAADESRKRSFTRNVKRSFKQYCESRPECVDHQKKLKEYNALYDTYMKTTDVELRKQLRPGKDEAEDLEFQARMKYEKMEKDVQPYFEQWCADNQKLMETEQSFWKKFDPDQMELVVVAVNPGVIKLENSPRKKQKTAPKNESDGNSAQDLAYPDADSEDDTEDEPKAKRPFTEQDFAKMNKEQMMQHVMKMQEMVQNGENPFA